MKEVSKAINDLTQDQILEFLKAGQISLCGFDFTTDDIVIKRTFSGDTKVSQRGVSSPCLHLFLSHVEIS